MSTLETLAANVLRGLAAKVTDNDALLTAGGAVFQALTKASRGEQSVTASMADLDAIADLHQLDDVLAALRAKSLADLASKR